MEEVDYHHREGGSPKGAIDHSNPRSSGELVIKKFMDFVSNHSDVALNIAPLTFMIASCPLLLGLIKEGRKGTARTTNEFVAALQSKLTESPSSVYFANQVTCDHKTWEVLGQTTVSKSGSSPSTKKSDSKSDHSPAGKAPKQTTKS